MASKRFPLMVEKYFDFLIKHHGFTLVVDEQYDDYPYDGVVRLQSSTLIIIFTSDRGDVLTQIRPIGEPSVAHLSIDVLVDYFTQGRINRLFNLSARFNSFADRIEFQLSAYANLLRRYKKKLLSSDLAWWPDAVKYFYEQLKNDYRNWTGEEMPEDEPILTYLANKGIKFDNKLNNS